MALEQQSTVQRVASEMAQATEAAKCHQCGCFQDAVVALEQTPLAVPLTREMQDARGRFKPRRYDCLGCQICWPASAINIAAEQVELPAGAGCATDVPERREGWPPYAGDYRVLRFGAPVAVCTLHSRDLVDLICDRTPDGLAIVGAMQTENLGIERLIENVAANPHIRVLILSGHDTAGRVGHFPGQSLLALVANGVDDKMRIRQSEGKRPFLRNVSEALIQHFRQQVQIVDHRECTDVDVIVRAVEDVCRRAPVPMDVAVTRARSVRTVHAHPPEKLVLDPAGYVVVYPERRRALLIVEHYDNHGVLRAIVEGTRATDVVATLLNEGLVSRTDHAAYLGRELALAERALNENAPYVQDRAPEPDDVLTAPETSCSCSSTCVPSTGKGTEINAC